jgi:hypothetical protein
LIAVVWPALLGLAPYRTATNLPVDERLIVVPRDKHDPSAAQPVSEFDWVDATQDALHQNDLRLVITSVTVQKITHMDDAGKQHVSTSPYLRIAFRLSNVGINHTIHYTSWAVADADTTPHLKDNAGRTYALQNLGVSASSQNTPITIAPLHAIPEALIFEPPAAGTEYLHLELPCSAFGAKGAFRIVIPKGRIAYQ